MVQPNGVGQEPMASVARPPQVCCARDFVQYVSSVLLISLQGETLSIGYLLYSTP